MSGRFDWLWASLVLVIAVALRLIFFSVENGMYFPDQMFQYLEPAHAHITGSGWHPWEFEVGARNWALPGFFGGWMEVGRALGLRRMGLYRFLMLLSALTTVLIVPAGYRIGRALTGDHRVGLVVAAAFGWFPLLAYFAPHTLSENPATLLVAWGYAFFFDMDHGGRARRNAFVAGLLLGSAFLCRTSFFVFAFVPLVDLWSRSRKHEFAACAGGLLVVVCFLAVLDRVTWGRPFQSVIEFVIANREVERHLAGAGLGQPWHFYFTHFLAEDFGLVGCGLIAIASPFVRRRGLALMAFWLFPLLAFTFLQNKQLRFALGLVPLLIANAIAGIHHLARRGLIPFIDSRLAWQAAGVGALLLCLSAVPGTLEQPLRSYAGTFFAQDWLGRRSDATGVLVGGDHTNGGYLLMERSIPLVLFSHDLADHPIFDYVIADSPAMKEAMRNRADFRPVRTFEGTIVYRRTPLTEM